MNLSENVILVTNQSNLPSDKLVPSIEANQTDGISQFFDAIGSFFHGLSDFFVKVGKFIKGIQQVEVQIGRFFLNINIDNTTKRNCLPSYNPENEVNTKERTIWEERYNSLLVEMRELKGMIELVHVEM